MIMCLQLLRADLRRPDVRIEQFLPGSWCCFVPTLLVCNTIATPSIFYSIVDAH
jgi:hypothetical protein